MKKKPLLWFLLGAAPWLYCSRISWLVEISRHLGFTDFVIDAKAPTTQTVLLLMLVLYFIPIFGIAQHSAKASKKTALLVLSRIMFIVSIVGSIILILKLLRVIPYDA